MKHSVTIRHLLSILVLLCLTLVQPACTVGIIERTPVPHRLLVVSDSLTLYRLNNSHTLTNLIGSIAKRGDTLVWVAVFRKDVDERRWYNEPEYCRLVEDNGDMLAIRSQDLDKAQTPWEQHWDQYRKGEFRVPQSGDKEAWARANYWVANNVDMKIQFYNDYLIQTADPWFRNSSFMSVNRLPLGDSVLYTLKSNYRLLEASVYIATGIVKKPEE